MKNRKMVWTAKLSLKKLYPTTRKSTIKHAATDIEKKKKLVIEFICQTINTS